MVFDIEYCDSTFHNLIVDYMYGQNTRIAQSTVQTVENCNFLVRYFHDDFFVPIRVLLVMKTPEDG